VPFADPYCPRLRKALVAGAPDARDGGTMVVVEGPRFSTRAESQDFAARGWSLVNMTGHPEAVLARELGLCYATIALVTDLDAGAGADDAVAQDQVFAIFRAHLEELTTVLTSVVAGLGPPDDCGCADWLEDVDLPFALP
jgi:5'-methylthioadenosine phosphorylase